MIIPENRQKAVLIFLPFMNEVALIISTFASKKSGLRNFYRGNVKLLIDYIVLISIVWSSCIVTYDHDSILSGFLHGCLTLLLSYIIPSVLMETVSNFGGDNKRLRLAYSMVFLIILILIESTLEKLIEAAVE